MRYKIGEWYIGTYRETEPRPEMNHTANALNLETMRRSMDAMRYRTEDEFRFKIKQLEDEIDQLRYENNLLRSKQNG
jgi:hypothetical protein